MLHLDSCSLSLTCYVIACVCLSTTRVFTVYKLNHVVIWELNLIRICGSKAVTFCKMLGDDFEVLVAPQIMNIATLLCSSDTL